MMKKLDKYKKIVRKSNGDLRELKRYGFVTKYVDGVTGKIYVHEKQRVVIKANYICNENGDKPIIAIPTVVMNFSNFKPSRNCKTYPSGDVILIQPLANASYRDRQKAWKRLGNVLTHNEYQTLDEDFDLHDGNVAMYKGKAVMIDW